MATKRPWLVMVRSRDSAFERIGQRYSTEAKAIVFAVRMKMEGWWDVVVVCDPVTK